MNRPTPGRQGVAPQGRLARTRPPGRDQNSLTGQALEYDLRDLADRDTVDRITQIVQQIIMGGGPVSLSLIMPTAEFDVAGSPAANGGAFTVTWDAQAKNKIFVGPVSGANAVPTFRLQVNPDLPPRSQIRIDATTMGATVTPDASISSQFSMVANQNFNLAAPINMLDGQKITLRITQDGTGGRTMTLAAAYRYSTYLTPAFVVLTPTAGATDYLGVEYNGDAGKFDIISFVPGVA